MNILVISDDGPNNLGFQILLEQAKTLHGEDKVIGFCTAEARPGMSFSIVPRTDPHHLFAKFEKLAENTFEVDGTPMDCLYLALLSKEGWLPGNRSFDQLYAGINQGSNVGVDVLHSGTAAVAMFASSVFGMASIAFSQQIALPLSEEQNTQNAERKLFETSQSAARRIMSLQEMPPGTCLNVNFPKGPPKGIRIVPTAQYSRWFASMYIPKDDNNDISHLDAGYITVSHLDLSVNPSMRY